MNNLYNLSVSSSSVVGGLVRSHPVASAAVVVVALAAIGNWATSRLRELPAPAQGLLAAARALVTGPALVKWRPPPVYFEPKTGSVVTAYTEQIDWSAGANATGLCIGKDVLELVFLHAGPVSLGRCGRVSRVWKSTADKVLWDRCRKLYTKSIFGRPEWINYAGDPGEIPRPTNERIAQLLCCTDPKSPPLLYYIPRQVGGVDWTLPQLRANAERLGGGYTVWVSGVLENGLIPARAAVTGWTVMERRLIADSRGEKRPQHIVMMQHNGGRMPELIELATILDAHRRRPEKERLFVEGEPYACYARCEWVDKDGTVRQGFVGGLSSSVLDVHDLWRDVNDIAGAVVLR